MTDEERVTAEVDARLRAAVQKAFAHGPVTAGMIRRMVERAGDPPVITIEVDEANCAVTVTFDQFP